MLTPLSEYCCYCTVAAALGGAGEQDSSRLMCVLEHLVPEISDMLTAADTANANQCDAYVTGQLGGLLGSFWGGGGVSKRLSEEAGVKMLPGATICGFGH